jgi:MFS family permease
MRPRPPTLLLAAAVQGVEAAGLAAAAVLSAVDTAAGRSYERSSGIALTVIAFGAVGIVAFIAWGIYRVRRWSRTPALLTQLFVGTTGVYLLEGHRLDWGVPALLLAIAGFTGLLLPPSLRALATGPASAEPREAAVPSAAQPAGKVPGKATQAAVRKDQPGTRPAPPAARTARPSGKKASSRRR